jgi:hypothetical protein
MPKGRALGISFISLESRCPFQLWRIRIRLQMALFLPMTTGKAGQIPFNVFKRTMPS